MIKKLLTILLSLFVAINLFTINVYAEWTGSGSGTQADPWLVGEIGNESSVTAYFDNGTLYINGTGKTRDAAVSNWAWYSIKDTITSGVISDGVTYIGKSIFRECSNLTSVSIPNSVTELGTTLFQECTSLTNIDLPNALTKIGSADFYMSGLTSITIPATVTNIGIEAFQNCSSLSSVKILSETPPTIQNGTFDNSDPLQIYVPESSVNTYKSATNWSTLADRIQAIPLTISDVLNTVDGGFPSSDSLANIPTNAWTKPDNTSIFITTTSPSNLVVSGCGVSYPLTSELTLESQNRYKFSNGMAGVVHFNMENNKLISIEIDNTFYANAIGTFTPPKTIDDILPSNFPNSADNGWIGPANDFVAYKDSNFLHIAQKNSLTADIWISKSSIASKVSDNQYKYHDSTGNYDILFNFDNNELISIELTGVTGNFSFLNGIYNKPVTVADIIPSNFPTTEASAWTNGSHKLYKISDAIKLDGSTPVVSDNTIVTSVGNGNYYFTVPYVGTVTFVMNNGKFTSIVASEFSSPDYNGTYEAPLTISDILNTYTNFPITETNGWVKENNSTTNRIYIDGSYLNIGGSTYDLNGVVTKEGNDYKYTSGMVIVKFIMESNVLKKINYTVMSASASGDYIPYKYEIEPTGSIPQGYTGNLIFKTNGQYTNDGDVVVKVNNVPISLNTQYTLEHGSIKVTLLGDYLKILTPGTYTVSIGVTGSFDEIESQFTIAGSSPSPSSRYVIPNTGVE